MAIEGYIDEIVIYDDRANKETIDFYEKLGLITSFEKGILKIISSRIAIIKSFGNQLELKVGRSHCNKLLGKGFLKEKTAPSHTIYDNLGTKVIVIVRKPIYNLRIGVLTSGGDAPGMNSAVRSIIRTSLKNDVKVFGIYRGYEGLIRGDIRKLGWKSETEGSGQGGTFLLSARSEKFMTREGRKEAAYNLFIRRINSLVVIGGDGSLTGAMKLKDEYEELCKELIKENRVSLEAIENLKKTKEASKQRCKDKSNLKEILRNSNSSSTRTDSREEEILIKFEESDSSEEFNNEIEDNSRFNLDIIGIPGTIDNDVIGVDFSLGANTALTRIMEVVEKLNSTMRSHKRIFVLECMGRDCGWLTLMAGFAVESSCILIPENANLDWQDKMLESMRTVYSINDSKKFIFLCEGAKDSNGKKIEASEIINLLKKEKMSARPLTIGHIQRGGTTCAFDRTLGTLSGMHAVHCILNRPQKPELIGMKDGEICILDLAKIIKNTMEVRKKLKERKFEEVLSARDNTFKLIYKLHNEHAAKIEAQCSNNRCKSIEKVGMAHEEYEMRMQKNSDSSTQIAADLEATHLNNSKLKEIKSDRKLKIGVLVDGMCACGMNAVLNSIIQVGISNNCEVYYFFDGYDGVMEMDIRQARIFEFSASHNDGGSVIGTTNNKVDIDKVKERIEELGIDYLIVIGSTRNLMFARVIKNLILIPASIENNCPGTQNSIGSDTALNMILMGAEPSRLMALNTHKKIFMIEIGGDNCGYLTVMGGIACGAFEVIYPEECHLNDLVLIKKRIKDVFQRQKNNTAIIFRNKNTFDQIPTQSICQILCSGTGIGYQYSVLGNIERGIRPTGTDKINARLCGFKAIESCLAGKSSGVVGIVNSEGVFSDLESILLQFDSEKDSIKKPEWLKHCKVCSSLE